MNRFLWALPAILLLVGCKKDAANARVDAALATLIPSNTIALAGIRIDKLKDTAFYHVYIEGKQIRQLEEFSKRTGLDPRKDLWEIVAATDGRQTIAFVRGKFGGMFGQEPRFEGIGTERRKYKGYSLLGNQEAVVTFMNASVAIAGPPRAVEAIIDGRDKPKEEPPQALLDMVHKLPGSCQIWAVTTSGGSLLPTLPAKGNLSNLAQTMASLQTATLFADLRDGLDLQVSGHYPNAASAKQIHDALRGMIGLGRLMTKSDDTDMKKLYDSIKVSANDTTVAVSVTAPFDLLEKLTRQLGIRGPA